MVEPQSKWSLRRGTPETFHGERLYDSATGQPFLIDEPAILQYLKDLAVTGGHNLDAILRAVAEAAQRRTGASGAAVAMWKDAAMVCRARSGVTAPPLGARLSTTAGISGECLRTGQRQYCSDAENDPRVDIEVCRSLGLRSIAVFPIQGWRGVNGILEVFSPESRAFSEAHLAFLQQLAAVAERARTFQPQGATDRTSRPVEELIEVQGILPASDRVRDVAAIFLGGRSRPFVIAGAVLGMCLLAFVIWLGWRGPSETGSTAPSLPQVVSSVEAAPLPANDLAKNIPPPEAPPLRKSSAGTPVQRAAKIDIIPDKPSRTDQPLLTADAAAMSAAPPQSVSAPFKELLVVEPPLVATNRASGANSDPSTPGKPVASSVPRSVLHGRLKSGALPAYPAQALQQGLQGEVVLEANVLEDGSVHDITVAQGDPTLANAAVQAVERWRLRPFQFNGRPVKKQMSVTVDFKIPDAPSQ